MLGSVKLGQTDSRCALQEFEISGERHGTSSIRLDGLWGQA